MVLFLFQIPVLELMENILYLFQAWEINTLKSNSTAIKGKLINTTSVIFATSD